MSEALKSEPAGGDPLVDALYELIRSGELSPGQRVDQRVISERLAVSRTPLREALRAMAADGVLTRTPNQGYAVAKLSAADLLQYYSLRTFLETQVLRSITWPDDEQMRALKETNDECERAAEAGAIDLLSAANRRFHFMMFDWSPLTILVAEIERVWRVSDPYRSLHLSVSARRDRVAPDHRAMMKAIDERDVDELVRVMDAHRGATRTALLDLLGSAVPPACLALPGTMA